MVKSPKSDGEIDLERRKLIWYENRCDSSWPDEMVRDFSEQVVSRPELGLANVWNVLIVGEISDVGW